MTEGVYFVDRERRIHYWNAAAERITGFSADEIIGRRCSDNLLNHVDETGSLLCHTRCPLLDSIEAQCCNTGRVYLHHRDGYRKPVSVRTMPMRDGTGEVVGGIEIFTDLSDGDDADRIRELEAIAAADELTGLPNRRLFDSMMDSRFTECTLHGVPFALAMVDVDHFKSFNDRHGHAVGDRVLRGVAKTLKGGVRPYDFAARWGGEEFALLLCNVQRDEAVRVVERCRRLVSGSTMRHGGRSLRVTVTAGMCMSEAMPDVETMREAADAALYRGKRAGRNRVCIHGGPDPELRISLPVLVAA